MNFAHVVCLSSLCRSAKGQGQSLHLKGLVCKKFSVCFSWWNTELNLLRDIKLYKYQVIINGHVAEDSITGNRRQ